MGKRSEKLLDENQQLINCLYQEKEITKKVYHVMDTVFKN